MTAVIPRPLAGNDCVAIVAGSGIAVTELLDEIVEERPFDPLPGATREAIPGHAHRFILGRRAGRDIVLQCGRHHLYEGLSLREATATIGALRDFGARSVVLTNAVGALLPSLTPGQLAAADLVRCWPYRHHSLPEEMKPDFVPQGSDHVGAHRWVHGPCYETRAEIAALRALGDATVGMSIAPELLRCQELGLRAGVLSCVTNTCGGHEKLTHEAVLAVAGKASAKLRALLAEALTP